MCTHCWYHQRVDFMSCLGCRLDTQPCGVSLWILNAVIFLKIQKCGIQVFYTSCFSLCITTGCKAGDVRWTNCSNNGNMCKKIYQHSLSFISCLPLSFQWRRGLCQTLFSDPALFVPTLRIMAPLRPRIHLQTRTRTRQRARSHQTLGRRQTKTLF